MFEDSVGCILFLTSLGGIVKSSLKEQNKVVSPIFFGNNCIKTALRPAVVAHTFNPSTWEAEAGGFLGSRPAWSTE
jgi:major histocompatibility complex class I